VGLGSAEGSTPPDVVPLFPDVVVSPKLEVGVEREVIVVPETDEEPVKLPVMEFIINWEKLHPLPTNKRPARPTTIEITHFLPLMNLFLQKNGKVGR
jgi:hypothetical protein